MWLQTFGDTHKFASIMKKSVVLRCTNRRPLPFSSESAQAKYKICLLDTLASSHYKVSYVDLLTKWILPNKSWILNPHHFVEKISPYDIDSLLKCLRTKITNRNRAHEDIWIILKFYLLSSSNILQHCFCLPQHYTEDYSKIMSSVFFIGDIPLCLMSYKLNNGM